MQQSIEATCRQTPCTVLCTILNTRIHSEWGKIRREYSNWTSQCTVYKISATVVQNPRDNFNWGKSARNNFRPVSVPIWSLTGKNHTKLSWFFCCEIALVTSKPKHSGWQWRASWATDLGAHDRYVPATTLSSWSHKMGEHSLIFKTFC